MGESVQSPLFPVAFQAIVDSHTGQCAGYEILARPDVTDHQGCSPDDVSRALANYKKLAKAAPSHRAVGRLRDRSATLSDLALE